MALTQTQQTLLAEAHRSPSRSIGVDWGYQNRQRFGRRRQSAAQGLVAKGLFVLVQSTNTPLYSRAGGTNGVVYTTVWRLA